MPANPTPEPRVTYSVSEAVSIKVKGAEVGVFIEDFTKDTWPTLVLSSHNAHSFFTDNFGPRETDYYTFMVNEPAMSEVWDWIARMRRILRKPRPIVGNLWLSNEARKATHKKWVLEVYGEQHVPFFKNLAERLAEMFKVEIHIRLESRQPKEESIHHD
jgi:hypothetical protein